MSIYGFGIRGYKNFCGEIQHIGPFRKINIFIGKNNVGKSNILLFIQRHLFNATNLAAKHGGSIEFNDEEIPQIKSSNDFLFCLPINNSEEDVKQTVNKLNLSSVSMENVVTSFLIKVFTAKSLLQGTEIPWIRYETLLQKQINELKLSNKFIQEIANDAEIPQNEWYRIFNIVTNTQGGNSTNYWIPEILQRYIKEAYPAITKPNDVCMIPAIRRVEKDNQNNKWDYSGKGLIERLAILQNPTYTELNNREIFNKINDFLKNVTGNNTAEITIPHNRETILIKIDNKTLPLNSLGTGIHEVVILAATATTFENKVICIEEPELHLHPFLQKKLINYLDNNTTNQYFISTHSSNFINIPGASIFHITLENEQAIVKNAISNDNKFDICKDLGYQASDLLQANSIIWVEGPSDRIYLNHWIKNKAEDLIEGLHYSIMFYGGKLLSHLTTSEEQIEKFISLKKLNRNISILMDSDKKHARDRIRKTVTRISAEFADANGVVWITNGKEIENYIKPGILLKGIQKIDPLAKEIKSPDKYCNVLCYITEDNKEKFISDKVRLANEITSFEPDYGILDLNKKVDSIIEFIRQSNE